MRQRKQWQWMLPREEVRAVHPVNGTGQPEPPAGIDDETARTMLITDFQQAFIMHNYYRDSERDLLKLALKILAFPGVVVGALLSAKLFSSPADLSTVLQIPFIWLSLVAAGILNILVVRAYVVTDRVQTEAKHQVNRLRSLYLDALADRFPAGWSPVWGSVNPYLETRLKFKSSALTPVVLGVINAVYISYGLDRLLAYKIHFRLHDLAAVTIALLCLGIQLEFTWEALRQVRRQPWKK
jgi:hypothetical protein